MSNITYHVYNDVVGAVVQGGFRSRRSARLHKRVLDLARSQPDQRSPFYVERVKPITADYTEITRIH